MRGRFTRKYRWAEIHALYMLNSTPSNLEPRFNICPTTIVDTVVAATATLRTSEAMKLARPVIERR